MNCVRKAADLLFGCLLIAVGLLSLYLCRNLTAGKASSMGPGYLPTLLAIVQLVFGLAIMALSLAGSDERLERWHPRPIFWVLAGMLHFGLTIERQGLAVAVFGLVILSSFAYKGVRPIESGALAAVLALLAVAVFVLALRLPFAILPAWVMS